MPEVYTHGHHESVLRSHTLADRRQLGGLSAAAPAADRHEGPGHRLRPGHHHRRPGRPGRRGRVTGVDRRAGVIEQARAAAGAAGQHRLRGRGRARPGLPRRHVLRRPRPPGAAARGDPVQALREMRRVYQAGRDRRGARRRLRRRSPGTRRPPVWTTGWTCTARWPAPTAASRTPGGAEVLGAAAGFTDITATSSNWTFATEEDRPGGAACGPTARSGPHSRPQRSRAATPRRRTWRGSPTAGASGPRTGRLVPRPARRDPLPELGLREDSAGCTSKRYCGAALRLVVEQRGALSCRIAACSSR